jgi:hypothetical protein
MDQDRKKILLQQTVENLTLSMIDFVKQRDLRAVTVEECIGQSGYFSCHFFLLLK